MLRIKKALNIVLVAALLAASSSCTTLLKRFGDEASNANLSSQGEAKGPPVVIQPAQRDPILSPFSRDQWLQIRDQASDPIRAMYATLATGDADIAIEHSKSYLAKHPGDIDAITVIAAGQTMLKQYELAAYYAGILLKQNATDANALNILGIAEMSRTGNRHADFERALALFGKAFSSSDRQIASGLNLGQLQLELGNATAAAATFAETSRRCNDCLQSLVGQGVALSRSGNYSEAENVFKSALSKKPNDGEISFHLALLYKNGLNDQKRAESTLKTLVSNPNNRDPAIVNRAHAVLRQIRNDRDTTAIAAQKTKNSKAGLSDNADDTSDNPDEMLKTSGSFDIQ